MKRCVFILPILFIILFNSSCAQKYMYTPSELEGIFKDKLNMNPAEAKEFLPFIPSEKTAEMVRDIPVNTSNVQAVGLILMRKIAGDGKFKIITQRVEDTTATMTEIPKNLDPIEHLNTFIALARQLGFEAVYVKVTRNMGYNSDEYFNYVENHICAGIKSGSQVFLFDFINNPRIYNSYKILNDPEAIAIIMNLRGVQNDRQFLLTGKNEFKKKAVACYKAAVDLTPDCAPAMNNLAVMDIRDGNLEAAEELLHKSMKVDNSINVARYNLAEIYLRVGRMKEAVELLKENIEKSPTDPYTNYRLGMIYFTQKKNEEAEECFKKAISYKKDYFEPRLSLISLYLAANRIEDAKALLKDSNLIFPENTKLKYIGDALTIPDEELPPDAE
jgi:tetratricopeptide (TPR) repeat protein